MTILKPNASIFTNFVIAQLSTQVGIGESLDLFHVVSFVWLTCIVLLCYQILLGSLSTPTKNIS